MDEKWPEEVNSIIEQKEQIDADLEEGEELLTKEEFFSANDLSTIGLTRQNKDILWSIVKQERCRICDSCGSGVTAILSAQIIETKSGEVFIFRMECRECGCQFVGNDWPGSSSGFGVLGLKKVEDYDS